MSPFGSTLVTADSAVIVMPGMSIGIAMPAMFMDMPILMLRSMVAFCPFGTA
ncbi:hypothetical protein D3C83_128310 [compost metagenome]